MDNTFHYVLFSDFNLRSNNRGTAALGYGAIQFLIKERYVDENFEIIKFRFFKNPFHLFHNRRKNQKLNVNGKEIIINTINVWLPERWLYKHKLYFFNSLFKKTIHNTLVAAINGGDGLTDIYGEFWLNYRLPEMQFAIELGIPFILLPQTIGPFLSEVNKIKILSFLKNADTIYVRDNNFIEDLQKNNLPYIKANDLSFYMEPSPFPIEVRKPCVGININGLAYSNKFGNLAGEFDCYPILMTELVRLFQSEKCSIYLIPHAYNVIKPETNNDDMEATRLFYESLEDKSGVYFIDLDLLSPQIKYLISKMDFFIGSRMHANYAAIFTGTPVFGLAYSYKFKGAFENNGIYNRIYDINNLSKTEIVNVLSKIKQAYHEDVIADSSTTNSSDGSLLA